MKVLLMYNPTSGNETFEGDAIYIKAEFEAEGHELDVYESKAQGDLTIQAERLGKDYDLVIASGGDGTVNEVLNGLMKLDKKPRLAIIPSGTTNDVAGILKIPKNLKKNVNMILNSEPVKIDVNQINDHYFLYVGGAGFLTEVSYEASSKDKKKMGKLAYIKTGLKSLQKQFAFDVRLETKDDCYEDRLALILMLAANRFGGMRFRFFSKKAQLDDGKIEIRTFKGRKLILLLRLALFVVTLGTRLFKQKHISTDYAKIEVLNDDDLAWNADGEKVATGSVELKVHKQAIEIYAHKKVIKKMFKNQ